MLIQSPTAEIVTSNPRALELLGLTEDQLLGKTSLDPDWNVIHEDGSPFPGPSHPVPQAIATRQPVHDVVMGVFRPVTQDRVWLLVSASPLLNPDGSVRLVVCTFADLTERKQAEEDLRRSEALRKLVLDSLQANVAVLDAAGYIRSVNEPWHRFACENGIAQPIGVTEQVSYLEVVRQAAQVGEAHAEEVLEGLQAVLTGTRPTFELEYPCDSPTEQRWFHMRATRLEGHLGGALVTHENITARKQAEEALRESEAKYRSLVDNLTSGVVVHRPDTRILYSNTMAGALLGLTQDQMLGKTALDPAWCFLKEDGSTLPLEDYPVNRVLTSGENLSNLVVGVRRPDSAEPHWALCNAHLIRGEAGQVEQAVVTFSDITERKRAEAALSASNEMLSQFLRHSPIYAFIKEVTAAESRVLHVSANFQQMVGISAEAMVGKSMADLFPADIAEKMTADDWAVVAGGKVLEREESFNGRCYETIKFPILQGAHALLAGFSLDITERKQGEARKAELEALNHQIQKAESLGLMAGSVAHHFNNKLQAVIANLELLSDLPAGAEADRFLALAKQAAERAADVSRQLLVYLGQGHLAGEPRYLSDICRGSLSLIEKELPAIVALEVDLPTPGPVILANEEELRLVLIHLMTNAWEAMGGARGKVSLSLRTARGAEVQASTHFPVNRMAEGCDYACLEVADTGTGIAEADLPKLFDPFFSTKFVGRGLGLPLVLGIVQAHGGVVAVESRPGHGSAFRVYLPVCAAPVAARTPAGGEPQPLGAGGTVLLVEDDEALLMATGALVERLGFTLVTARDGLEAVEVYRRCGSGIRLVITDLTMPRLDGWQTLSALRRLEPGLPIILTSGYDKAQVMSNDHPDRPQAFLGKPFDLQQLQQAIGAALHQEAPRA
ncbi:PAS domain-containing protein [Geothrix sp. PMB-07]|uniref:PAS domain-containing hybrid sensor histidine kinase/response regulator n=1 Tax=Geothrix sp. PMB-07 TaxID=3068640 RepID=UPI002741E13F|nr:PAS domain-containing protein [Geothrix sp. PMB-07]WLT32644.1 PAS domain-containing protein [Geothrix sp. PMB-07]